MKTTGNRYTTVKRALGHAVECSNLYVVTNDGSDDEIVVTRNHAVRNDQSGWVHADQIGKKYVTRKDDMSEGLNGNW